MDIDIIDKFISNSITIIQNSIKKTKKADILKNINKNLDKIISEKKSYILISQVINISLEIYLLINDKNKLEAKLSNSDITIYIYKFYNIYLKFIKLIELKDVKSIFEKIEDDEEFFELKEYSKELGEERLSVLLNNEKKIRNDYLAFMIIYIFIYIKDYRIKIFEEIEKNFLKKTTSKKITYFTTNITKIDYSDLLNSLPKDLKYKTNDFYEMLYNIVNKRFVQYERNDRYYYLFTRILIPVIDDFQRIHKSGSISKNYNDEITEKRGQTIVKSILSDIRSKQDFYINKEKNNKQLFPSVLEDIKGVFYDELLELRILGKLDNKLMINNENLELYNSLENIRKYNFINFINNPDLLLNFEYNEPIESIRDVSTKFFKKTHLQTRMMTTGFSGDIVKFAIKHPTVEFNEIIEINTDYENKPMDEIFKVIEKLILDEKFFNKNKYILFTYKLKKSYKEKIIDFLDKLFINYEHILYSLMLKNLKKFNKSFTNMYDFKKSLKSHYKLYHKLSPNNYLNSKFELDIYNHFKDKVSDEYDEKEDYIPGLFNDLIILPKYKIDESKIIQKVEIDSINEPKKEDLKYNNFISENTCHHFIAWKELQMNRKNNPNKYNQLLYEFIKKYAIKSDNMFICKSCSFNLKISVDVTESYQAGMANILAINLTTERPLEELREYEKFSSSIKNIDKMVEKIASFYSFNNYIGSSINSKKNRNEITKEVIDFLNIHNKTLRINDFNKRRQREKNAYLEFGISTEFSNYFLFKLENEIFKFSTNDTDKFKRIKINNIFIVIVFCFYLRLNYNIFVNVATNDKYCNYFFFEKYGDIIFKDLKILSDFDGNKKLINKIPNLKFYLFMMACNISKYKLWFPKNDVTLNLATLKSIIHTFTDLYNTVVSVIMKKKKSYIYEYFAGKLLHVENNILNKKEYLDSIKNRTANKIKTDFKNKKINFIRSIIPNTLLNGVVKHLPYKIVEKRNDLSLIISKNKTVEYPKLNKKFNDNLLLSNASKLTKFYDKSGKKVKLENETDRKFTTNTAIDFIKKINLNKKIKVNKSYIAKSVKEKIVDSDLSELKKNIIEVVNIIKSNLGNNLLKKNKNIRISEFKYKLDFNHLTVQLKKPIYFNTDDTKIINKFNRNIMIIKINKYFYTFDPNTLNYLGFYEKNKNFVEVKNKSKYLIPEYSLLEQLLYMGLSQVRFKYTLEESNIEILNRYSNLSFFIKNFISNLNLMKNTTPKLKMIKLFNKDDNYKYIFEDILNKLVKNYVKYKFNEDKKYSISEIINKSKEINNIYIEFIKDVKILLDINKNLTTNISEFIVDIIFNNFNKFNISKYNSQELKFDLILNSDTIIIGDVDTGIGFYGDVNFVEQLTEDEKQKEENEKKDDEFREEALDTDQLVEDDEETEDMGDEEVQMGVGEI